MMIQTPPQQVFQREPDTAKGTARPRLRLAQSWLERDRQRALDTLNDIFRSGSPPEPPLEGRFAGELLAIDISRGLSRLFQWLASHYQPWKGKAFDSSSQTGENIFSPRFERFGRLFWPFYRQYHLDRSSALRAFPFRTCIAPGLFDPDRQVLKIDYDLEANPGLTVRRVLDELVQVDDRVYLGKAQVHWWWGRWQTLAYFTLAPGL